MNLTERERERRGVNELRLRERERDRGEKSLRGIECYVMRIRERKRQDLLDE